MYIHIYKILNKNSFSPYDITHVYLVRADHLILGKLVTISPTLQSPYFPVVPTFKREQQQWQTYDHISVDLFINYIKFYFQKYHFSQVTGSLNQPVVFEFLLPRTSALILTRIFFCFTLHIYALTFHLERRFVFSVFP